MRDAVADPLLALMVIATACYGVVLFWRFNLRFSARGLVLTSVAAVLALFAVIEGLMSLVDGSEPPWLDRLAAMGTFATFAWVLVLTFKSSWFLRGAGAERPFRRSRRA